MRGQVYAAALFDVAGGVAGEGEGGGGMALMEGFWKGEMRRMTLGRMGLGKPCWRVGPLLVFAYKA